MKTREIKGKDYVLVVLRITDWDDKGRPSAATIGWDDSTFDLRDPKVSREFMTAWVPAEMAKAAGVKSIH